jgi:hypothetical protein
MNYFNSNAIKGLVLAEWKNLKILNISIYAYN